MNCKITEMSKSKLSRMLTFVIYLSLFTILSYSSVSASTTAATSSSTSSKKTIASINKNLVFDNRKEISFNITIDDTAYSNINSINSKNSEKNVKFQQIKELLKKKISNKVIDIKLNKHNQLLSLNNKSFSYLFKYWLFFKKLYLFDRRDIDEQNVYSIVLETNNLKSKIQSTSSQTSLIIIQFDFNGMLTSSSDSSDSSSSSSDSEVGESCCSINQSLDDNDTDNDDEEDEQEDESTSANIPTDSLTNTRSSSSDRSDSSSTHSSPTQRSVTVTISGTSNSISKTHFTTIINTLKTIFQTDLTQEIPLLLSRYHDNISLSKQTKKQIIENRQYEIKKILHPEKYAKPKGRVGKNGEASGRYKPSEAAQARRQVKKG